ncbi:tRNA (cytidine(34)-2'-O)-methyltransferase [Segnochrobactraceae bacterium EtOH-i3]
MRLALYQPDIPQNAGTLMRLCACLGVEMDLIGPAGFDSSDRMLRRAGMDYASRTAVTRHVDWAAFETARRARGGRLVLLSTRGAVDHVTAAFAPADTLLLGRESAGVPDEVHAAADLVVRIPMRPEMRSLNVAIAGAMVLGEALRQTGGFPVTADAG